MSEEARRPPQRDRSTPDAAWAIVSYLLGGMAVWGAVGWLVDRWVGTAPFFLVAGLLLGVTGGLYLTVVRYGR
ncbi:MAG: AtpZ/AtpI family protein [Actinomycetes bacterium]